MNDVSLVPVPWDERVLILRYGDTVDAFAIAAHRFTLLIDTLVSQRTMARGLELLRASGLVRAPLLVINTHADWDHAWGNGLFAGPEAPVPAPVIAHRLAAERLRSPSARETLTRFQRDNPDEYATSGIVPPTISIDGSLTLDGGDLTFHLIPTPGHTPDHIAVWVPEIRLLIAGDAAELPFPYTGRESDLSRLRRSLLDLERLGARWVLYCHSSGLDDPALVAANSAYYDELERRCRACLERGQAHAFMALLNDPSLLGWPVEEAVPSLAPTHFTVTDFHRRGHGLAIRAMLRFLQQPNLA